MAGMGLWALPPEVISGRMYAGPGSGPMLAAGAAWDRLAAELGSAAIAYQEVIAELTGQAWSGPAAEAMAAAATPYAVWLGTTAANAEQTASAAAAAASAFEEAHAAVVPPPVIAANRSQLAVLVATNLLGQNSAAIADAEVQYLQMWIQDVLAMSGYAARSAAAASVAPFSEPPATTNSAGLANQPGSVAQAGTGATHSQLSQLITALPQALRDITSPTGSPVSLAAVPAPAAGELSPTQFMSYLGLTVRSIVPFNVSNISILFGLGQQARNFNIAADIAVAEQAARDAPASLGSTGLAGGRPVVSADVGTADTVGKLAVPPSWLPAAPEVRLTAAALPDTSPNAAPAAASDPSNVFADMAVAGLAGGAIAGRVARGRSAPGDAKARLERLADKLTGSREVRHWQAPPGELKSLLTELSRQPGVHTVQFDPERQAQPAVEPRPSAED